MTHILRVSELDPIEKAAAGIARGERWWKVKCSACGDSFDIEDETLDRIIGRYGYVCCARCGTRLYTKAAASALTSGLN